MELWKNVSVPDERVPDAYRDALITRPGLGCIQCINWSNNTVRACNCPQYRVSRGVTICCISPYPCDAVPGHVTARDNSRKVSSDHIRYKDLCHTLLMILIIVTPDSTHAPYHAYAFYSFSIRYHIQSQ